MRPENSSPNSSTRASALSICSSIPAGMVMVVSGIVGGGVEVELPGGGMVGGGLVVELVAGGMVGGGGNVGNSGNSGIVKVGVVKVGTLVGGVVCAPAEDMSSPALPTPPATTASTRRFQTCIPTSRTSNDCGGTIYPSSVAPVPSEG